MFNLLIFQVGDRLSAYVSDGHSYDEAKDQRSIYQALSMLRRACIVRIYMQWVLVHGHQTEPGIVELGDGSSWPMLKNLAYLKFLEIAAKDHESISIPKGILAPLRLYAKLQHVRVSSLLIKYVWAFQIRVGRASMDSSSFRKNCAAVAPSATR
jgi:hypothetical protein